MLLPVNSGKIYITQYGSTVYIYRDGHGFPLVVYIRKSEIILSVCGFLSSNLVNVNMWP